MDTVNRSAEVCRVLRSHQSQFANVVSIDLRSARVMRIDLSSNNKELQNIGPDADAQEAFLLDRFLKSGAEVAMGGYGERRTVYEKSELFGQGPDARCVHLGVDIWLPAGTAVFAPLEGRIHSYRDNEQFGDYGPTIVLEHSLEESVFYTLYGHLSRQSLEGKEAGQCVARGEEFGTIGIREVNGDWPPHLHFQVIVDMLGHSGDFPGVVPESDRDRMLTLCPDPNLILGVEALDECA